MFRHLHYINRSSNLKSETFNKKFLNINYMANVQYIAFLSLFFQCFAVEQRVPTITFLRFKNPEAVWHGTACIMSVSGLSLESHCLCSFGYYCSHCGCFCTDSSHSEEIWCVLQTPPWRWVHCLWVASEKKFP